LINACGGGTGYIITVNPSISDLSKIYKFYAVGAPYDTNACYTVTPGGATSGTISTISSTYDDCSACAGTTTTTTSGTTTTTAGTTTTTTAAPTTTTTTTDGTTTSTTTTTAGTTTTTTAAPFLYYFNVTECGGSGTTQVSTNTNMTVGSVYKLMTASFPPQTQFDGARCWQVIEVASPGGTLVTSGISYGDCSNCNATTTTTTSGTTTTTAGTTTTTTDGTTTTTAGTTTTTTSGTTTTTEGTTTTTTSGTTTTTFPPETTTTTTFGTTTTTTLP
jgi:hypothetical protein